MAELMLSLMLWIGDHSQHDVFLRLPTISQVNHYHLCMRYGIDDPQQCENSQLKGFYNKRNTIYLPLDFTTDSLDKQSELLHELVHFAQWENMHPHEAYCLGEKEAEAYRLQNTWRVQHGLNPVSDEFTLMMLTASCED